MLSIFSTRPDAQTEGFVCPICAQPLDLVISEKNWTVMGQNASFGHLWNTMLPRGFVFGRLVPMADGSVMPEPVPKYIPVCEVQGSYTPMHSRCLRDARHAWVQRQQATCGHERVQPWSRVCPECRLRLY